MANALIPIVRAVILTGLLMTGAACVRPTGDFGRARPSVLHDEIMPAIGKVRARKSGEPVSDFNLTDEEQEMRNRVWRFLVSPHSKDWSFDMAAELQRTRISPARDAKFEPDRYYAWLRKTEFRSSRTRYQTIAGHAKSDLDTLPETFRSICAAIKVDRQRAAAAHEIVGLDATVGDEVAARRAENEAHIGWFTRALGYRSESYGYALDHLLVETPHEEARNVDARLFALAGYLEAAERGDFCDARWAGTGRDNAGAVPSRFARPLDFDPGASK